MARKSAVVFMLAVLSGSTALAQAQTNAEIVVTASRSDRETREIPANVSVITSGDILAAGYNNVVEALSDAGGVSFRSSSGNASQSEIQMRGFGENSGGRVLVLLDGQKMNRPDMAGINWLQIPLANVDRIEIIRGADSVLHGDHAVGGVVNIVTKKGTKEPSASVALSGGSFGANAEQLGFSGSSGRLSYSMNAEHDAADGYRDRSAYGAWGAGGSLNWDISESVNALLKLSANTIDFELPGWLSKEKMDADPRQAGNPDDNALDKYHNATLELNADVGSSSVAKLGLLFGRKDIRSDMASWFSFSDVVIDTFGVTPSYLINASLSGHKNSLLIGADYYLDTLSVVRFAEEERALETSSARIDKSTLGAYLKNEFNISDSLVFGAGGRVERANIGGRMSSSGEQLFDEDIDHDANAVDASLTYLFGKTSKLFTRFSTIYRYPFVDEQVSYFGFGTDQVLTNLTAETGAGFEAGVDAGLLDNLRAGLTVFLTDMNDEIAFNPVTMSNENLDETRHRGAEASVKWNPLARLSVDAGYTYTEAKFTGGPNDGKDIPLVPRHTVTARATVGLPRSLTLGTTVRYTDASWLGGDYANAAERLPSHVVTDLILRYAPDQAKGLNVFVAVDNLFNAKYANLGYLGFSETGYYPSPERGFRAGASWRF